MGTKSGRLPRKAGDLTGLVTLSGGDNAPNTQPFIRLRPGFRPVCTDAVASVSEIIASLVIGQKSIVRLCDYGPYSVVSCCLRCVERVDSSMHVCIGGYLI